MANRAWRSGGSPAVQLGIVPPGTQLAPKPEAVEDWDRLSADEKRLFTTQVEVRAASPEAEAAVKEARESTDATDDRLGCERFAPCP